MERYELKSMWHEAHKVSQPDNKEDIEKIIGMKHSKIVAKVLVEQKKKAIIYSICFFSFILLLSHAFLYLKASLSINSIIPLVLAGLFLFIKTISEINRHRILTSSRDEISIRDSILFFQNKVNKIGKIDFIFNICLFYTIAVGVSIVAIDDKAINGIIPFLIIFILISLSAPWLINHLYQQEYKKLYSTLEHSLNNLDN